MNPISPAPTGLQRRPTSGKATASLVFGIAGLVSVVPAMLAIIFGHLATEETRLGWRSGHGRAIVGVTLGYIVVIPLAIATIMLGYLGVWSMLT